MELAYLLLQLMIKQKSFDHGAPFIKWVNARYKVRQMMTYLECVESYKINWD